MKKLLFVLLLTINVSFSQDVMDKIAKETCECINAKNINLETIKPSELEMQLGLCMMQAYGNNKEKLPKNKRFSLDDDAKLEKFGEEMGLKMINYCPEVLVAVGANEINKNKEEDDVIETTSLSSTGTLIERKIDGFLTIRIKEESGKINDFILVNNFENAYLISDDVLKPDTKIKVEFYYDDVYDIKLNKFVNSKVLVNIQKI